MKSADLLIDRYVAETVRLLPAKGRQEAEERLREKIAARMAARFDGPPEEVATKERYQAAREVLVELGPPEAMATALRPARDWLIAPHLMPRFLTTAAICFAGLVVLKLLGAVGGSHPQSPADWLDLFFRLVASLDDLVLGGLVFLVVLVGVFLVIERTLETEAAVRRRWDPRELLRKDPERVGRAERTVGMLLAAAAFVVLNFFPHLLGAHVTVGGEGGFVPLTSPAVAAQLALINLSLLGTVAFDVALLWRGRWSALSHLAEAALSLLSAFILWRLHQGPPLLVVDGTWMAEHGWSAEAIARYRELLGGELLWRAQDGLRWVALIVVVVAGVEIFKALRATLRRAL